VLCVWSTVWQAASATFAFHKVMCLHYAGEVSEFIIFQCEISLGYFTPKTNE